MSPTVSADVATAAKTDETTGETDETTGAIDERTAAIAGELGYSRGKDQVSLDLRRDAGNKRIRPPSALR